MILIFHPAIFVYLIAILIKLNTFVVKYNKVSCKLRCILYLINSLKYGACHAECIKKLITPHVAQTITNINLSSQLCRYHNRLSEKSSESIPQSD